LAETATQAKSNPAVAQASLWFSDLAILVYIALATILAHVLTGGRYGFHRDELATLDDARHLDWGFVAYPPITPFFGRLSLILFGTSLAGFRFFAAVAQAAAVVLTGLICKQLGGRRGAQLVAAVAALPFCLGAGGLMQYVSFDYFFWVLAAYFVVRLLNSDDPRWWLAIGAAIGLGMQTKYTMGFLVFGIVAGALFTSARRYFLSKWLWCGVAVSLLVFLPNLLWQVRHDFISLDFLNYIHARDVSWGRARNFLPDQLKMTLLACPLWLAGLYFCLLSRKGKHLRMVGWMYVVPLVLFTVAKGRAYYLAPAYPMLYAAGSTWGEQWLDSLHRGRAKVVKALVWAALLTDAVLASAVTLRLGPVNSALWRFATRIDHEQREELGWPELVETVVEIRDKLPAEDRARLGILTGNYGEAGAVNLYGPQFGLPTAISGTNSFWLRGYGNPPPQTLIVLGMSRQFVEENFVSCELAAHPWNRHNVKNEETEEHPEIYLCRGLKQPWPEFWRNFRRFG